MVVKGNFLHRVSINGISPSTEWSTKENNVFITSWAISFFFPTCQRTESISRMYVQMFQSLLEIQNEFIFLRCRVLSLKEIGQKNGMDAAHTQALEGLGHTNKKLHKRVQFM